MTEDERALLLEMAETLIDWDVQRRDRIIELVRRVRPGFPPREQLMRTMAAQGTVRPAVPQPQAITAKITAEVERMRVLTVILLHHPRILPHVRDAYERLQLPIALDQLRTAICNWFDRADSTQGAEFLHAHLVGSGLKMELDQVLAPAPVPLPRCAFPSADPQLAIAGWWHVFGFLNLEGLGEEIRIAEALCAQELTATNQNRLLALKAARNVIRRAEPQPVHLPSNDRGGFR